MRVWGWLFTGWLVVVGVLGGAVGAQSLAESVGGKAHERLLAKIREAHQRGDLEGHDKLLREYRDFEYLRMHAMRFLSPEEKRQLQRGQRLLQQMRRRAMNSFLPPVPAPRDAATPDDFVFEKLRPHLEAMKAAYEARDERAHRRARERVNAFRKHAEVCLRALHNKREREAVARLQANLAKVHEQSKPFDAFNRAARNHFVPVQTPSLAQFDKLLADVKSHHQGGDILTWLLAKREVDRYRRLFQAHQSAAARDRKSFEKRKRDQRAVADRMARFHHWLNRPPGEQAPAPYDVAADRQRAAEWLKTEWTKLADLLRREREAQRGGSYEQWTAVQREVRALERARGRAAPPVAKGAQTRDERTTSSHVWMRARVHLIQRTKRLRSLHDQWCKLHPRPARNPLDEPAPFPAYPLLDEIRADLSAMLNGDAGAHARHVESIVKLRDAAKDDDGGGGATRAALRPAYVFNLWRRLLGRDDQRRVLAVEWLAQLKDAPPGTVVGHLNSPERWFGQCNAWWGKGIFFARTFKRSGHTHASKAAASARAAADVFAYQQHEWHDARRERRARHPGFQGDPRRRGRVPRELETRPENLRALRADAVFTMAMTWMLEDLLQALRDLSDRTVPDAPPFAENYDMAVRALNASGDLAAIKARAKKARAAFLAHYGDCDDVAVLLAFDSAPYLRMLGLAPLAGAAPKR